MQAGRGGEASCQQNPMRMQRRKWGKGHLLGVCIILWVQIYLTCYTAFREVSEALVMDTNVLNGRVDTGTRRRPACQLVVQY